MELLQDQPQRMAREKRGIEQIARAETWLCLGKWSTSPKGLQLSFRLPTFEFDGLLVYPPLFPKVPAYVRPKSNDAWSRHQYGNGVLCLERGPDNWDPSVTGAELLRSAYKLLFSEMLQVVLPGVGPTPSRHELTLGQIARSEKRRFLVTGEFAAQLENLQAPQLLQLRVARRQLDDIVVSVPVAVGPDNRVPLKDVLSTDSTTSEDGWVFAVSGPELRTLRTAEALRAIANSHALSLDHLNTKTVVACDSERNIRAYRFTDTGELAELAVIDARESDTDRLPPEFAQLATKRITVVGTGSLGSKVAVSLARSGVRQFVLIDADVLLPQNLVRNELDTRHLGFAKVASLAQRIKEVATDAKVVPLDFEVGGQENPEVASLLADVICHSDLVIDATASSDAFVTLAALCGERVSLVWGEVFAGGVGAMMARSRPGRDSNPLATRAHIYGVMSDMADAPRFQAKRYGLETEEGALVAGDAEVSSLAASMTAFAIDAVCREESEYPVGAYLIGFKKFWEFRAPFDTIPIACPPPVATVELPELTADEVAALDELAKAVLETSGASSNAAG